MAVRLSVVLVQTMPPGAKGQRLAEEVVGSLIGLPGMDLTLVAPLESLGPGSSDRLTLDSLAGDVAILDWYGPEKIVDSLQRLDFVGRRSAHEFDNEAEDVAGSGAASASRRIYAFDLGRFSSSEELIQSLNELNSRRQVRTFSIGMGGGAVPGMAPPARPQRSGSTLAKHDAADDFADRGVSGDTSASRPSSEAIRGAHGGPVSTEPKSTESGVTDRATDQADGGEAGVSRKQIPASPLDLDQLLDELDELDP